MIWEGLGELSGISSSERCWRGRSWCGGHRWGAEGEETGTICEDAEGESTCDEMTRGVKIGDEPRATSPFRLRKEGDGEQEQETLGGREPPERQKTLDHHGQKVIDAKGGNGRKTANHVHVNNHRCEQPIEVTCPSMPRFTSHKPFVQISQNNGIFVAELHHPGSIS